MVLSPDERGGLADATYRGTIEMTYSGGIISRTVGGTADDIAEAISCEHRVDLVRGQAAHGLDPFPPHGTQIVLADGAWKLADFPTDTMKASAKDVLKLINAHIASGAYVKIATVRSDLGTDAPMMRPCVILFCFDRHSGLRHLRSVRQPSFNASRTSCPNFDRDLDTPEDLTALRQEDTDPRGRSFSALLEQAVQDVIQ